MTKYVLSADLDETLLRTIETDNETTYVNADLVMRKENMAVYYRPHLLEFLYEFLPKEGMSPVPSLSQFQIALFTKGTTDYAKVIIDDILVKLKDKYKLNAGAVKELFKVRLYREDLNSNYKDLGLIAKKTGAKLDNILLVDDLISNFTHQPGQGIQILKYAYIRPKDNELYKLKLYLQTLDTSGALTLKEQNIFRLVTQ